MVKLVLLLLVWLALPVSGGLYCLGGGYSHSKEISFSYTCLNETSTVKVACQFTISLAFKALRMDGIDQHCHSHVQPGLNGTEISCSFAVSTVLTGSMFECASDVSGSMSFNITLFSDECVPPVNSRIVVRNSATTFQCNDGFIFLEKSRALCELQLHTNIETIRTHPSSHWVPMITSGCVANISNDTTELNTQGNSDWLWLIPPCVLLVGVGLTVAIICKKKAEKSNMRDDLEAAKGVKKDKEIPTDNSIALDSNEKKETNDDIESWFLTPQNVVDPAVGSTGIIMSQVITTPKDGPRSRKNREFQSSNDNLKDLEIPTELQSHSNLDSNVVSQLVAVKGSTVWSVVSMRGEVPELGEVELDDDN